MKEYSIPEDNPMSVNEPSVLYYLQQHDIDFSYLNLIKKISTFTDEMLSRWMNISVKTFRFYKQSKQVLKENLKEHVYMILALTKHGNTVFSSPKDFEKWLSTPNFFFDNKAPETLMTTISGIRFIDERLTAIEYGDNV